MTQEDLETDPGIAGRPVILQSRDGHAIWVSRRTLEENAPYPDQVEGGVIFRDDRGNPTGEFCCFYIYISTPVCFRLFY